MSFLTFLLAAVTLAITPGPGIAYVVARTASGGRPEGLASCAGTGLDGLVHVLAAALGLSLVIAQSAWAFSLLKCVGAAYLVYLGLRMLFHHPTADLQPVVHPQGARRAFVEGIVVEAFNVKTALFFMAFLPQFVSFDMPVGPQLVLLGCICVALNTLVDVLAVMWADRLLRSSVVQASRARILNYFSGCTMVALGVFLATARRSD